MHFRKSQLPKVTSLGAMTTISLPRRLIQRGLNRIGYHILRVYPLDYPRELIDILESVKPYTMASQTRIADACAAVDYIVKHEILGDILECGVWRGGSMMAIAMRLMQLGDTDRELYLCDTFSGMPEPTSEDIATDAFDVHEVWKNNREGEVNRWCYASLDDVRRTMHGTGYNSKRIHFVKGKVEDTLPSQAPEVLSLLRLDTDFYASTKHELEHLFPRLVTGGVLIVDDYGYWGGSRRATDEYLEENRIRMMLHRSDAAGRIAIKQE